MMAKPVILLVPGAWHTSTSFSSLTEILWNRGYIVHGVSLASVGASPAQENFDGDVQAIITAIRSLADQGLDIIMFFHSYGGIPGSSACRGFLKSERQLAGKPGGIVHLIFCAAFAIDEGVGLIDMIDGESMPWWRFSENKKWIFPQAPVEHFYNDVDDRGKQDSLVKNLKSQSYGAFVSKVTYAAWKDVESTYVVCQRDEALPMQAQQAMLSNVNSELKHQGRIWQMAEISLDTSHSPFVSQPESVARIVRKIAGEHV